MSGQTAVPPSWQEMVTIVTGGAGGIGSATCLRLAQEGTRVVVVDRDGDAAQRMADALPTESLGVVADVTVQDDIDRAVAAALERWGRIDALVTAAGFARDALLADMSDELWEAVLGICLYSPFACSRAVAPLMRQRGFGRIVHLSSRAYLGNPGQANYSAAKAGVVGLTKALAKELGRDGITVNAVAPGFIRTPMTERHPKFEALVERATRESSVRRVGVPDDVAEAIAFLVSPRSPFVTGDVVHVSGGRFG